jgi:uncharacterized phage protein gp47/JayE
MAFKIPTLKELRDAAIATINAKIQGADALLRNSVLNVLATIVASVAHSLYQYISWISRQCFPDTAESLYLNRWGYVWGITRKMASFAFGKIIITGNAGSLLPVGTVFQATNGLKYIATESVILTILETADISVKSEKTGYDYNLSAGMKVSLLSPVAGINSDALVGEGGITGGTDVEDDNSYRGRILNRIQEPPRGGCKTDYEHWALEVPGVTRAWCYPTELGAGTVTVRFMMDDSYPDGIPQEGDLERVKEYISAPERKPVAADIFVEAPIAQTINIMISDLVTNTPEIQNQIRLELKDFFVRETEPGGVIYRSRIDETISATQGEVSHTLTLPDGNIFLDTGKVAVLGEVIFS